MNDEHPAQPLISIEEEMSRSYVDYAMSVIVARALPDVRDGFKPVHRRILYAMKRNGYESNKPYRKCARIVGDVMGQYHPHGDSAIYEALVRMAQDFSLRLPLIDGQGNFGSMDGDRAAAMRYTEARLAESTRPILDDIEKDTVDFKPNYDESTEEPEVLPAGFPHLLVNGAGGIAVGMATNVPPHNLGEVIDAAVALMKNPGLDWESLLEMIPAPDFPTGGLILGHEGARQGLTTGRGSVIMRARVSITHPSDTEDSESSNAKQSIIVHEIPYQVNKARLLERIAETVQDKLVEGVSDLRDESDREGVRVVIELKRGAVAEITLAQLFRHTPLQTSFGVNMLALHKGQPMLMNVRQCLEAFLEFREQVIIRRTAFLLHKTRERAHVLIGLLVALNNLDAVIAMIRSAPTPAEARTSLINQDWQAGPALEMIQLVDTGYQTPKTGEPTYRFSEAQAQAILELRLQRLTAMERSKLVEETRECANKILGYLKILQDREHRKDIMCQEMLEVKERFATPRRTTIEPYTGTLNEEDLVADELMVVTATHGGYIKRVPLITYRAQRRGGKGRAGMNTRDEDFVVQVFVASSRTTLLFFSSRGLVYQLKVYRLPEGSPQARGRALVNLLPLAEGESISTILPITNAERDGDKDLIFATRQGHVRRNRIADFARINANGKIAMKLSPDDRLVSVRLAREDDDIFLATRKGRALRFPVSRQGPDGAEKSLRVFVGRSSQGVRGVRLQADDAVVAMFVLKHAEQDPETRSQYLKAQRAALRMASPEDKKTAACLEKPPFEAMCAAEEFILSVGSDGMGLLCSAYDYRCAQRGGQGIKNIHLNSKAHVVASFKVNREGDNVILVTDSGKIIRLPLHDVNHKGRDGRGVRLFDIDKGQSVVSAARIADAGEGEDEGEEELASTE